ncbi:hypothetical protein Hanom_Chr14g01311181 [Helianthus anomalus]
MCAATTKLILFRKTHFDLEPSFDHLVERPVLPSLLIWYISNYKFFFKHISSCT